MKKPASLRTALTAAIPDLKTNPADLAIWVEDGKVRATQTKSGAFSFEYPLSVLLKDCATDIAIVTHAIVRWLRVNQPDLLKANGDSFTFETDVMDHEKADIVFTLQLVERVTVAPIADADGGGWALDYAAEPPTLFDDDEAIGAEPAVPIAGASADAIVAD